jgi:acyl-CoA synthetase (AMP-forming)/AMP-acid ligase II/acyl carrier protein
LSRPAEAHGEALGPDSLPGGLAEALLGSVERDPDGRFIHIDTEGAVATATYAETLARARRVLGALRQRGFEAGDAAILYLANCADFVTAAWAVLLGGGVIAPLMRREASRRHAHSGARTLRRLAEALGSPWLIGDDDDGQPRSVSLGALRDGPLAEAAPAGELQAPRVIVLTSGTTTEPRLVILSERAALARWWPNVPAADQAVTFLTWSPFDHVMGMGVVSPNVSRKVSLAPDRFAAQPTSWLDAIARFAVTHATTTNSGLALVEAAAAAVPERRWDLTRLRKVGVGAEAISPRVCRRFMATLSPSGLAADAVILGYGLSECGPVVGGQDCFVPADDAPALIALDRPTRGHAVRIVDATGAVAAEGEIGEVQVRGSTMTCGYLGDAAATAVLFTDDGWLRTGDLGLLRDERLTITGREKEQIAIHGAKYACPAIEAVAERVEGVEAAYAAACADRRPGRGDVTHFALFVVPSGEGDQRRVAGEVVEAVAGEFGQAPCAVVPIGADAVPRTPSGKPRRQELGAWLDAGRFDGVLADLAARTPAPAAMDARERAIAAIWTDILGAVSFGPHDDFFTVGGDSVAALRMVLAVERAFDTKLPKGVLHGRTTISALAAWLDAPRNAWTTHRGADIEARLRALTLDWPGEPAEPLGLVRGVNRTGAARPWFWCVQEPHEVTDLARAVGAEHPLYAMRSGNHLMEYTPANTAGLAARYLREMLAVDPTGPYLLGGECQGAIVAHEIARQLLDRGKQVALLALIDTDFWSVFDGRPYPERVACFAGARSRFNPLRTFRGPERGWRKLMTGGVRFTLLPADHLEIFAEPAAALLATGLAEATAWALGAPPPRPTLGAGALPDSFPGSAYVARITPPASLTLAAGAEAVVAVEVRNESPVEWRPEAAIALGNHWLSPDGELVVWADGRADLARPIPPGCAATMSLAIRAPTIPGRYLIEFDLVEEGVTWFKDKAADTGFSEAVVTPRKRFDLARLRGRRPA